MSVSMNELNEILSSYKIIHNVMLCATEKTA